MTESNKQRLIREFHEGTRVTGKLLSPEERARLVAIGAESGIRDEDLPVQLGDVFSRNLSESFGEECNNLMKGQIVQMAGERGVTTDQLLGMIRNFMTTTTGEKPRYDA